LLRLFRLDFAGAGQEFSAAFKSIGTEAAGGVVGGVAGGLSGAAGGAVLGGLAGSIFGPAGTAIGSSIGGALGGAAGSVGGAFIGSNVSSYGSAAYGNASSGGDTSTSSLVQHYAELFGVNPRLALALSAQESGLRHFNADGSVITSATGARGVMQLTSRTARGLGVNRDNPEDNVKGGMMLFSHLLQKYGDAPTAIAAYHEGETKMSRILAGRDTLSSEARDEVAKVMRGAGASGDVQVGSIVIHITKPNATNADVGTAVVSKLREMRDKKVQRNLAEGQDASWSYG
jgi:hypothetical protein